MVERARRTASFRLVVLSGRAYVERYRKSFQTRDVFTIWGMLQLLRRYPKSHVRRGEEIGGGAASVPVLRDDYTLDIVFPDWSFWGWPEINIKPWEHLLKEMMEGNQRVKWMDRERYAYWKGNPLVASKRRDLLHCNVSDAHDWNARIFVQDWERESQKGFEHSNLAKQCLHRYKIYIEGSTWSVSEKYILACDSPTLLVKPQYYDFFSRGLFPQEHYWPIRDNDKCRSIEFAVDWGNTHKRKPVHRGRAEYGYRVRLYTPPADRVREAPAVPALQAPGAVEYCAEFMACGATGRERTFMVESMVEVPREAGPCALPPPFDPEELSILARRKADSIRQVEIWEDKSRAKREKTKI
ncbi:unnamed protein product [Spirodela intermedia]|uniref:Glycosyl transferase CAP10 domain-containing protein n=1 Tax=Spirodela intermedia TaxID=51605 RepID=A0A7I8ID81_SPIIN|nr:unnamed protein product [Spirodela intermedia]CAA6655619.1 unnamed protein product [Spirodela intermedia]